MVVYDPFPAGRFCLASFIRTEGKDMSILIDFIGKKSLPVVNEVEKGAVRKFAEAITFEPISRLQLI